MPRTRRKPNYQGSDPPVSRQELDAYLQDPLLLIGSGRLKVHSSYRVDPETKLPVPVAGEARAVPFEPQFEQQVVVQFLRECRRRGIPFHVIVAKARGCGLSAIAAAIITSCLLFAMMGSCNVVCLGPGVQEDVVYPFFRNFFNNLPQGLAPVLTKDSKDKIEWYHNSPFQELAGREGFINLISSELGAKAGVGTRSEYQWITEFSKMGKAAEVLRTMADTVMLTALAVIMKESTCEGKANRHYRQFDEAWKAQGCKNFYEDGFIWDSNYPMYGIWFPYFHNPNRVFPLWNPREISEWPSGASAMQLWYDLTDYEKMLYHEHLKPFASHPRNRVRLGLTRSMQDVWEYNMRQLYWLRGYCAGISEYDYRNRGIPLPRLPVVADSLTSRYREMPATLEEAFTDADAQVFGDGVRKFQGGHVRPPDAVGYLDERGRFFHDQSGWLKLWVKELGLEVDHLKGQVPSLQGKFFPPYVVFLGVDMAHGDRPGDPKTDFSTIVGITCPYREQVLEVEVREKTNRFGDKVKRVMRFLSGGNVRRTPYINPESADAGRTLAHELDDEIEDHSRLYMMQRAEVSGLVATNKPGFDTSSSRLDLLSWQHFESEVLNDRCVFRSHKLLDQVMSMIRKDTGCLTAPNKGDEGPGSKDDLVDAYRHALWWQEQVMQQCAFDIGKDCPGANYRGQFVTGDDEMIDKMKQIYPGYSRTPRDENPAPEAGFRRYE